MSEKTRRPGHLPGRGRGRHRRRGAQGMEQVRGREDRRDRRPLPRRAGQVKDHKLGKATVARAPHRRSHPLYLILCAWPASWRCGSSAGSACSASALRLHVGLSCRGTPRRVQQGLTRPAYLAASSSASSARRPAVPDRRHVGVRRRLRRGGWFVGRPSTSNSPSSAARSSSSRSGEATLDEVARATSHPSKATANRVAAPARGG